MSSEGLGFQFPYTIPLKVFGPNTEEFQQVVYEIVQKHIPQLEWDSLSSRPSTGEKYVTVTVSFTAESREQLVEIYRELNGHELVLMTL